MKSRKIFESEDITGVSKNDILGLVDTTIKDGGAKSLVIMHDGDDDDLEEAIRTSIDGYISDNELDENSFVEISAEEFDENTVDDLFNEGVPEIVFVPDAENADAAVLDDAAKDLKIIALCRCDDECPCDDLSDAFEFIGYDEEAEDAAENDDDENEDESNESYLGESVTSRFAKYSSLYESENEESSDEDKTEDSGDEENAEEGDKEETGDDKEAESEENEDVDISGILVTVKRDDVDKCKEGMIEAGIAEDDIEVIDEDEESENVDIKVDVNSIMELKAYLEGKDVDLEKKIGVTIVDEPESDETEGDSGESGDENDSGDGGSEDVNFDEFDDIFGGVEDEK